MSAEHGSVRGRILLARQAGDIDVSLMRPAVPESSVPEHVHDEMHLVLLLGGAYVSTAAGMPPVCQEPTLVFNPPGVEHRDRFRSRDGLFLVVTQPAAAFAASTDGVRAPAQRLGAMAMSQAMNLLRAVANDDPCTPLVVQCLLAELLGNLGRADAATPDAPVLRRALDFLHSANGWPDVATLAATAQVHPVYLARVFRRALGVSPGQYVRRLRALAAMRCLARGHSADAAALRCGFVDASHLGRCLRRELGVRPGMLRRAAKRSQVSSVPVRSHREG